MLHAASFPPRHEIQPDRGPNAVADTAVDAALLKLFEKERENLVRTVKHLEALRARLGRQLIDGSHLAFADTGQVAKQIHMTQIGVGDDVV